MNRLVILAFAATLSMTGCAGELLLNEAPSAALSAITDRQPKHGGLSPPHQTRAGNKRKPKAPKAQTPANPNRRTQPLTRSEARELAQKLGYTEATDPPFSSHGQAVFKSGNNYITPDKDVHKGGAWKMFDHKGNRLGTFNDDLTQKVGD